MPSPRQPYHTTTTSPTQPIFATPSPWPTSHPCPCPAPYPPPCPRRSLEHPVATPEERSLTGLDRGLCRAEQSQTADLSPTHRVTTPPGCHPRKEEPGRKHRGEAGGEEPCRCRIPAPRMVTAQTPSLPPERLFTVGLTDQALIAAGGGNQVLCFPRTAGWATPVVKKGWQPDLAPMPERRYGEERSAGPDPPLHLRLARWTPQHGTARGRKTNPSWRPGRRTDAAADLGPRARVNEKPPSVYGAR